MAPEGTSEREGEGRVKERDPALNATPRKCTARLYNRWGDEVTTITVRHKRADRADRTDEYTWKNVPKNTPLGQAGVKQRAVGGAGVSDEVQAFNMGTLKLPPEKGPVEKVWKDVAARGALQAIIDTAGDVKAGLKQERPSTDQLRRIWLQKVRWEPADAEANWKKITTPKDTFEPTRANQKPCQVDHILELQFGGNNVRENMQMLDGPENMKSGRDIFQDLKRQASEIRTALKSETTRSTAGNRFRSANAPSALRYSIACATFSTFWICTFGARFPKARFRKKMSCSSSST